MSDINRINPSIVFNKNYPNKNKSVEDTAVKSETENKANNTKLNYKSADEVLDLLDKTSYRPEISSSDKVSKKTTIKISDYVTPDQAQRISASAHQGMNILFSLEDQGVNELGLSQSASQKLAVKTFESNFMPQ